MPTKLHPFNTIPVCVSLTKFWYGFLKLSNIVDLQIQMGYRSSFFNLLVFFRTRTFTPTLTLIYYYLFSQSKSFCFCFA